MIRRSTFVWHAHCQPEYVENFDSELEKATCIMLFFFPPLYGWPCFDSTQLDYGEHLGILQDHHLHDHDPIIVMIPASYSSSNLSGLTNENVDKTWGTFVLDCEAAGCGLFAMRRPGTARHGQKNGRCKCCPFTTSLIRSKRSSSIFPLTDNDFHPIIIFLWLWVQN